jgi:bacillithiol synthase
VINACKKLKEQFPDRNFVPVYWMASEDHDYEEIKSFRLYGKKYSWETKQTGAVGRFRTDGLAQLAEQVPGDTSVFKNAYTNFQTLAAATRCYVNDFFGSEGLVVIDADDARLKSIFKNVIREDVLKNIPKEKVEATNKELEALGYHTQIYARDINFFHLDKDVRSRIEKRDDKFVVLETDISFSKDQIEKLIETNPEKFSPNVILRPLYQEMILPNIAYAGGPAEVIYWLQLKSVFDYFKVSFPMLMPRNFAMVMDEPSLRKFEKTGLELKDLFEDKNYLFNHWISRNSKNNLSLTDELSKAKAIFESIGNKAVVIDNTLIKHMEAQSKSALQSIENIEKKMLRAEKRLHADKLGQLAAVKDFLFPNGSPQERVDNFLNFYQQDPAFIQTLLHHFDPFDFRFNILLP